MLTIEKLREMETERKALDFLAGFMKLPVTEAFNTPHNDLIKKLRYGEYHCHNCGVKIREGGIFSGKIKEVYDSKECEKHDIERLMEKYGLSRLVISFGEWLPIKKLYGIRKIYPEMGKGRKGEYPYFYLFDAA